MLQRAHRLNRFFWAGLGSTVAGWAVLAVMLARDAALREPGDTALWVAAAALNGGASTAIAWLLPFALGAALGFATTLQLLQLSRPDHPLVRDILRKAPGTYQHCLQVANLAEQAAERVGANPRLLRVGALYNDCGKALNPQYFIENQAGAYNIHTELEPAVSAGWIIRHVTDGLKLARQHRLPGRIQDFIAEHHGTLITRYQYANALKAAGGDASHVDEKRSQGSQPQESGRSSAVKALFTAHRS